MSVHKSSNQNMLTDGFLASIFIFSLDFSFQFVSPEGSCRVHSHQHWTNSSQGTDGKNINQLLCSVWEISVSILLTEYLFSIRNNYLFFLSHSFLTFIFYKKTAKGLVVKIKNIYFSDAYIFYKLPFSSIIHSLTRWLTQWLPIRYPQNVASSGFYGAYAFIGSLDLGEVVEYPAFFAILLAESILTILHYKVYYDYIPTFVYNSKRNVCMQNNTIKYTQNIHSWYIIKLF